MSLWDWASEAYRRPDVEAACLALQDEHGQCVTLLLWALWAQQSGRGLSAEAVARAAAIARPWHAQVIEPLRAVRRNLKATFDGVADPEREALRTRIKSEELQAEQILLQALEAIDLTSSGAAADALSVLTAAAAAWAAQRLQIRRSNASRGHFPVIDFLLDSPNSADHGGGRRS